MRRAAWIAAALVLASAAPTAAAPVDVASSHTGLRAYRAYLSSLERKADVAGKRADAFIADLRTRCPDVLKSVSFSDTAVEGVAVQFGKEAGADLVLSAFVSFRHPLATLSRRIGRLQWSSPVTGQRLMNALGAEARVFALMPRDLCADASALAANGGRKFPPAARAFLSTFQRETAHAARFDVKRLLLRHRGPRDARLVRELGRLQDRADTRFGDVLTPEVPKLLKVLGLLI
jgi:hypothetical protein